MLADAVKKEEDVELAAVQPPAFLGCFSCLQWLLPDRFAGLFCAQLPALPEGSLLLREHLRMHLLWNTKELL